MFSKRQNANSGRRFKPGSCLFTVGMLFPIITVAATTDYDTLVVGARAGNRTPLLNYFQQQEKQTELTPNQVADWLQVLSWADDNNETLNVWQRYHNRMVIPARGQIAVARSLRNEKQWNASLAVWEKVLRDEPNNADAHIGWIMTLADAQHNEQALTEATQWAASHPGSDAEALLIYVYGSQGKNWDALFVSNRIETRDPRSAKSKEAMLSALSASRVSGPALELSNTLPVSDPIKRRLELDAAAENVRIAFTLTSNEKESLVVADNALARYARFLETWGNNPSAQADVRRARIDRLGALLIRKRTAEIIKDYESLQAEGDIPAYAKRWVASALLTERQPAKAETMLMSIFYPDGPIPIAPLTAEDNEDLFNAHLENEHFSAAMQQITILSQNSPYLVKMYGSPAPQPNADWLLSQTLLTQYYLATNFLPAAQKQAAQLANTAAGNQDLRITYASVLQARGLPRAAEQELKIAETLEPTNLNLERQQASVALDLQEWKQADELTDDVIARSPDDVSTKWLARARDVHKMSELRITGSQGIASNNPISGTKDFHVNSALYSPPIDDHWRLFTGFNFATGEFDEGHGISRDVVAGAEWTSRDCWAEMAISGRNYGEGQKIGGRLSAWHDFNDNWRVGASAERLSQNTPLRALRNGITADGGEGFVRWYQNERREYQLSLAGYHFSDGNNRMEYAITGKERMLTTPHFTLDFTPAIGGSTNSMDNVPYYSPKNDLAVLPALSAEHVLYHNYETVWKQQIQGGVGGYWQSNHGGGVITQLGYGQRVQWNNVVDSGVMLAWEKRPFDGKREQNLSLSFDLNVRF